MQKNEFYLVKASNNISKIKVFEATEKAYRIQFQSIYKGVEGPGYDLWIEKTEFERDYKIIEHLKQ